MESWPKRAQLAAVARVARLGTVAQGEQGLLAAQPPAGLGDREHLVGAHGVGAQVAVGSRAKVQYEQTSRHRFVSGMKTLRE